MTNIFNRLKDGLEGILHGNGSDRAEKERIAKFQVASEAIGQFLGNFGDKYALSESGVYDDDGQLIDKAGEVASRIMFKEYPRYLKAKEVQIDNDFEDEKVRNARVCDLANSLREFIDIYLKNSRIRGMDYGIVDHVLPTFNPNARSFGEQNRLTEADQYRACSEKLANGVADFDMHAIENYSLRDACKTIATYADEFVASAKAGEINEVVRSAKKIELSENEFPRICREIAILTNMLGNLRGISGDRLKKQMQWIEGIVEEHGETMRALSSYGASPAKMSEIYLLQKREVFGNGFSGHISDYENDVRVLKDAHVEYFNRHQTPAIFAPVAPVPAEASGGTGIVGRKTPTEEDMYGSTAKKIKVNTPKPGSKIYNDAFAIFRETQKTIKKEKETREMTRGPQGDRGQ